MTRGQKQLDEFKYELENEQIRVPVWLVRPTSHDEDDKVYFRAKYGPAGIDETNTDINKLKDTVQAKLKEWYKVDWELYIMVLSNTHEDREKRVVSFGYEFYAIGKRPNGKTCYIEVPEPWDAPKIGEPKWLNKDGFWNGKWNKEFRYALHNARDGTPKEGEIEDWGSSGMRALLPATKETVNTVLAFEMRLKAFGEEMTSRFSPEFVKGTLGKIQEALKFPLALPEHKEDGER